MSTTNDGDVPPFQLVIPPKFSHLLTSPKAFIDRYITRGEARLIKLSVKVTKAKQQHPQDPSNFLSSVRFKLGPNNELIFGLDDFSVCSPGCTNWAVDFMTQIGKLSVGGSGRGGVSFKSPHIANHQPCLLFLNVSSTGKQQTDTHSSRLIFHHPN